MSYIIAKDGELPEFLDRRVWNKPLEGLLITSAVTLLVANFLDLSSISMMGSAGFLLIFAAVNASNFRLATNTGCKPWLALLGLVMCLLALAALVWQRATTHPQELWVLVAMVGLSFTIEASYRALTGRKLQPTFARKRL